MDEEGKSNSSPVLKSKKPGPRPTRCMWCGSTECTHCRCTGQSGCNHKKGEMCPNQRYKRRLVCNSCEKNKLREKQQMSLSSSSKRKRGKVAVKASKKRESVKASVKVKELSNPVNNQESTSPPVFLQNNNIQLLNVFLTNHNSTVGSLCVQGSSTRLSALRPNILQIISHLEDNVDFVFLQQGIPIQMEREKDIALSDVIRVINNMPQIDITLITRIVHPVYPTYSEIPTDLSARLISDPTIRNPSLPSLLVPLPVQQRTTPPPSLATLPSQAPPSLAPLSSNPSPSILHPPTTSISPTHPSLIPSAPSGILPQPQPQPQPSLLLQPTNTESYSHEGIWSSANDTPLQKLLREATTSGRVDAILSQANLNTNDFVFDDRPRDLHSRGGSYTHVGSIDNFYSRPGSMIFPPNSIPGSMTFNYFGSNTSLDNAAGYDDMVNKLRALQEDDMDKGAPSL